MIASSAMHLIIQEEPQVLVVLPVIPGQTDRRHVIRAMAILMMQIKLHRLRI